MDASLFWTTLGTLMAILTFIYTYYKEPREDTEYAIQKFEFLKKLNTDLINDLTTYMIANNAQEKEIMQQLTFEQGIRILQKNLDQVMNDKNLENLKKGKSGKRHLDFIIRKLEENIQHCSEIRTVFEYYHLGTAKI
ncbi:hypothetical protein [Chitinophaga sp. HK235]|uniref:hypothetical protein n=1 Tax=Chitinophaga sp. HK235 TaxID=2952571 RepID=UPI001BA88130|nr:hypothetical protein [Chitinophaga sp. HK235]